MKDILIDVAVFLLSAIVFVFLAWVGGYNFDHRGPEVRLAAVFGLLCSIAGVAISRIARTK